MKNSVTGNLRGRILHTALSLFALSVTGLSIFYCSPTEEKEAIIITAPEAGRKFLAGDTISAVWTQAVSEPQLSYNYNLGTGGWQEFTGVIPVSDNEVKVILPTLWYSDSFQIRVEDISGAFEPGLSGHIITKYIIITNPPAGQTFSQGDTVNITLRTLAEQLSSLLLMLSTDNGKTSHHDMLTNSLPPTTQSVEWVVGAEPATIFAYPSTECQIKVRDYENSNIYDVVGPFTVQ